MTTLNFLAAESKALNEAYAQFFGENKLIGVAFIIIKARKQGQPFTSQEEAELKSISRQIINQLKNYNLTKMICQGIVRDCAMSRRFMSTGSGFTKQGYTY